MATIDLGKIKFNWRNEYNNSTPYVPDDCVYYTDGSVVSSYICKTASTGNAPSSGGTLHGSWDYLAKGQNASPTTTQGDLIVRGASADQRLAIGTAGQVLKVNSSANGLEYGGSGTYSVHKIQRYQNSSVVAYTGGRTDYVDIAGGNYLTFNPTSTDDFVVFGLECCTYAHNYSHGTTVYVMYSTSTTIGSGDTKIMYDGQHATYGEVYHYSHCRTIIFPMSGLTVGTNYYFEMAGASHPNSSNRVDFNYQNHGAQSGQGQHVLYGIHYKKN
jgi:hypothetical protein